MSSLHQNVITLIGAADTQYTVTANTNMMIIIIVSARQWANVR